jgi:hypothetical protein
MNNLEIKVGQVYEHYKGNHYRVLALGKHSETGEELVTYKRVEDDAVYSRPKAMFFDEIEKDGKKTTRFVLSGSIKAQLVEIFGWYGAIGLLVAYALLSFDILSPENAWYHVINITAALGIVIVSFYKRTYQPGTLNIVWAIVGLIALIKILS